MNDEWYCQWCEMWHSGETNCKGQDSRDRVMDNV
jgi:hypothetical protein